MAYFRPVQFALGFWLVPDHFDDNITPRDMIADGDQFAPSASGEIGVEPKKIIKIDLCRVNHGKGTQDHHTLKFVVCSSHAQLRCKIFSAHTTPRQKCQN